MFSSVRKFAAKLVQSRKALHKNPTLDLAWVVICIRPRSRTIFGKKISFKPDIYICDNKARSREGAAQRMQELKKIKYPNDQLQICPFVNGTFITFVFKNDIHLSKPP